MNARVEAFRLLRYDGHFAVPPGQLKLYLHVCQFADDHGYPPTVRDLMRATGIASPSGIHCHLKPLERKGLIATDDGGSGIRTARGIRPLYRVRLFSEVGA